MRWSNKYNRARAAFTLIEVVLAIGIFLVTVLALVGLLGPTLQSVDEVEKTDEVASVVNTVNAFLQNSPEIAPGGSKFDAIYEAVATNDFATMFVFRRFESDTSTEVELVVGFESSETSVDPAGRLVSADFDNAAGPIYRVVLSASSVTPEASLDDPERDATTGVFTLSESDPAVYPEGYFAMEVRIFAEDWSPGFDPTTLPDGTDATLENVDAFEPMFTYNTAVVR